MRELVSVQLGGYANYVGAHFWNLQDESLREPPASRELDQAVLLRECASPRRYAPRLQIVDLSGAFGSLSLDAGTVRSVQGPKAPKRLRDPLALDGGGYDGHRDDEDESDKRQVLWEGDAQTYERASVPLSPYLQSLEEVHDAEEDADGASPDYGLDSGVSFWSDYLKVRLHPRTCYAVPGVHAGVDSFSSHESGASAAGAAALDEVFDGLRFFAEDCDSLGGVVFTIDAFSGFAGFGEQYLARMRDELGGGVPITVFGASAPPDAADYAGIDDGSAKLGRALMLGRVSEAVLVNAAVENEAQYVPLRSAAVSGLPYVHPTRAGGHFHTSAILGAAIDVGLAPMRHKASYLSMASYLNALKPAPFASVSSLAFALPVVQTLSFARSALLEVDGMVCLSSQAASARSRQSASSQKDVQAIERQRPVRELVAGRGVSGEFESMCNTTSRVAVPIPFPRFFDERININGHFLTADSSKTRLLRGEVGELSALASSYTDAKSGHITLSSLGDALGRESRVSTAGGARGTTEPATFSEASEALFGLANDYQSL
jgi:hypothetical protein